uniref:Uncharacterized protein n=1 Tax=Solanum tuberosum TaxID=4113 RepID=M1CL04_SOLTU
MDSNSCENIMQVYHQGTPNGILFNLILLIRDDAFVLYFQSLIPSSLSREFIGNLSTFQYGSKLYVYIILPEPTASVCGICCCTPVIRSPLLRFFLHEHLLKVEYFFPLQIP